MNLKITTAALIALGIVAGCTPQAREQYDQAGDTAAKATEQTGDAIQTDAAKSAQAAQQAGQAAVDATKNAAENAADASMTPKVKAALQAASGLETKNIDVDTANNTITLKGSVPTEAQKQQAQKAVEAMAGTQYKVNNQLTVSGATGAKL